jgi:hypothetical protein
VCDLKQNKKKVEEIEVRTQNVDNWREKKQKRDRNQGFE